MNDKDLEMMIAKAINIGTIQTLKALGLLSEVVTVAKAESIYGKRLIKYWRQKGWVTFYPAKNKERGKSYCKRSELETASLMLDIGSKLPDNRINKLMQLCQ